MPCRSAGRGRAREVEGREAGWAGADQVRQWVDVGAVDPQAEVEVAVVAGSESAQPGQRRHCPAGAHGRTVERADGDHHARRDLELTQLSPATGPANAVRPGAGATTGDPSGAARSIPRCPGP